MEPKGRTLTRHQMPRPETSTRLFASHLLDPLADSPPLYIIFAAFASVQIRDTEPLPELPLFVCSLAMEASPSRSDSFSHGWLRCKARPAAAQSFKRPGGVEAVVDDGLGHSFNSSAASFIDMDPGELFSMRWTSLAAAAAEEEEDHDFDFSLPCNGAQWQCSPLLVGAGRMISDGHLLLPGEPGIVARDGSAYADVSPSPSSPLFHSALSTPASVIITSSRRAGVKARAPLPATRRILLRYLRFFVPLCRKVKALPRRMLSTRSRASLAASTSPARRSTSSSYASAAEYGCHGNADTAVRDAILYCKKSIGQDM